MVWFVGYLDLDAFLPFFMDAQDGDQQRALRLPHRPHHLSSTKRYTSGCPCKRLSGSGSIAPTAARTLRHR
jgi:hypothetical protein